MHRQWQQSRRPLIGAAFAVVLVLGAIVAPAGGGANRALSNIQIATPGEGIGTPEPVASPAASAPVPITNASLISVTHGVAAGDITATSAVIWSRASAGPAEMHVDYDTDDGFGQPQSAASAGESATEATDFTATLKLDGLSPDTIYFYRVWFSPTGEDSSPPLAGITVGTFRTAPDAATTRPISFIVGGDLGGQQYCRRPDEGYKIFAAMQALTPDFFIANGDLIYADGACPESGPATPVTPGWTNIPGDFPSIASTTVDWTNTAQVKDIYDKHWRYNRADPHHQAFLADVPMYAQWDDHEVINDFGAAWTSWNKDNVARPGYQNLVAAGRDAMFYWNPIDRNPTDPNRIYRSFNWGKDADLFIADARSYRSRNDEPADTPGHTMLGAEQIAWLKQGLLDSRATWKVVSMDIPISIPTGSRAEDFGRDGFANGTANDFSASTGAEAELLDILEFADDHDINNLVFVVTDVHFTMTIRYDFDANGDGDMLVMHELVSGPLNAVAVPPPALDPTFNPTLLYSEGNLFNFSYIRIEPGTDGTTHLIADVRDPDGQARPGSYLDLTPEQ